MIGLVYRDLKRSTLFEEKFDSPSFSKLEFVYEYRDKSGLKREPDGRIEAYQDSGKNCADLKQAYIV
jgi:hypothetical protein